MMYIFLYFSMNAKQFELEDKDEGYENTVETEEILPIHKRATPE